MTTKTVREAADFYRVTPDTIRTWCRMGAVKATKTSGRWTIESSSLSRRDESRVNQLITAATQAKRGWSKASRRRSGGIVHDWMEDFTSTRSPARPGQCHYCGLDARTCDCR